MKTLTHFEGSGGESLSPRVSAEGIFSLLQLIFRCTAKAASGFRLFWLGVSPGITPMVSITYESLVETHERLAARAKPLFRFS
jgi:hypothetical protein